MDLFCVNCGAPLEADDAFCAACGVPRAASLPPGTPAAAAAPAAPVEPAAPELVIPEPAAPEPVIPEPFIPGPVEELGSSPAAEPFAPTPEPFAPAVDPAATFAATPEPFAPAVEPFTPEAPPFPPDPTLVTPPLPPASEPFTPDAPPFPPDPALSPPPEPFSWETPAPEPTPYGATQPAPQAWDAPPAPPPYGQPQAFDQGYPQQGFGQPYPPPPPPPSGGIGTLDIVLGLIGLALAFGAGVLFHADIDPIQEWISEASFNEGISGSGIALWLFFFAPYIVAMFFACMSRVPGLAFLGAVLGLLPWLIFGDLSFDNEWPIAVTAGAFLLVDLVLLLMRRSPGAGLVAGIVGAVAVAAYPVLQFQRAGTLSEFFSESSAVVQLLVVPAAVVALAGLIGGVIGGSRRS